MSYVPSPKTKLVYALMGKRITEDDFFRDFPASKDQIGAVIQDFLEKGLAEKNPDFVETAIPLAYRYGLSREYLAAFNALALESWHFRHEDVVFALGLLKDSSSVEVLAKTALANHPYLDNDEFFALGTKSIHALENIHTLEAIHAMGEIAKTGNEVLKDRAVERLRDIAKNGMTEPAKSTAMKTLDSLNVHI